MGECVIRNGVFTMINYKKIIGAVLGITLCASILTGCGEDSAENENTGSDVVTSADTSADITEISSEDETVSETTAEITETNSVSVSDTEIAKETTTQNLESNVEETETESEDYGEYDYFEDIDKASTAMSDAFISAADKYISDGDYTDLAEVQSHSLIMVIEMMIPYTETGSIDEILEFMMSDTGYSTDMTGFMKYTFDMTDIDTFNEGMSESYGDSEFAMSESDYPKFQEAVTDYMVDYFNEWTFSTDTSILTVYGASADSIEKYYNSLAELMNMYELDSEE